MIPYQELRIGNHVLAGEKQQQISMIDQRSAKAGMAPVDQTATSAEYPLNSIRPVTLTDEVLKQCGFVYHDYFKFWQLVSGEDQHRSEMDIDPDYNLIDFMRRPVVRKITSLHQLQNIYYLLKGKELIIREAAKAAVVG